MEKEAIDQIKDNKQKERKEKKVTSQVQKKVK